MSATILSRPQPAYTRSSQRQSSRQVSTDGEEARARRAARRASKRGTKDPPPLYQRAGLAAQIYGLQGFMGTMLWFQDWREWWYPPQGGPDIVKAYEARPGMGVRIFFPNTYDQTSPQTLPTLLTIHGGGFCIGTARDDDASNRALADTQHVLVISLPYNKAPRNPYPTAVHDLEALAGAVLADESLPIDRSGGGQRVALLGFDAGGTLALALSQALTRKGRRIGTGGSWSVCVPGAVVSLAGLLDLERPLADKMANRRPLPPRAGGGVGHVVAEDGLVGTYEACVWSYVPYGQDLRDPLLSPAFARWAADDSVGVNGLPPHVCLVGAELDVLAHESWRTACRLVRDAGRKRGDERRAAWRVPDPDSEDVWQRVCGRAVTGEGGEEMGDYGEVEDGLSLRKRFGFEERWGVEEEDGRAREGSVKWILVPDVLHGFNSMASSSGGAAPSPGGMPVAAADDDVVRRGCVEEVGKWLRETVWKS